MGFNTMYSNSGDTLEVKNLTNNTFFKCQIIDKKTISKLNVASGFNIANAKLTILNTGYCNVNLDDKISLMGNTYAVIDIGVTIDNQVQFRHRRDFSELAGSTVIALG